MDIPKQTQASYLIVMLFWCNFSMFFLECPRKGLDLIFWQLFVTFLVGIGIFASFFLQRQTLTLS